MLWRRQASCRWRLMSSAPGTHRLRIFVCEFLRACPSEKHALEQIVEGDTPWCISDMRNLLSQTQLSCRYFCKA